MTEKLRAEIDAKTATILAQSTRVLGEANVSSVKLAKEAKAERLQLLVNAIGGPDSYERVCLRRRPARGPEGGNLLRGPGHPLDRLERI